LGAMPNRWWERPHTIIGELLKDGATIRTASVSL
jgi:hypothetical protein